MVHLLFMLAGLSLLFGFLLSRVLLYRFGGPILELKRRIENVVRGCPEEYREAGFYNAELNGDCGQHYDYSEEYSQKGGAA